MLLSTAVLSSSAWGQASTPATGTTTEPVTPVVLDSPGTSAAAPVAPTTPSTAPEPVSARTPEAASAASNPDTVNGNDNIVVTARFRNERLQDTPLSISAFNATSLQNSVITDVQSVQKFLPNVQLSRIAFSGNALGASIRGVSFADLEKTFDPAIGVAIDGVFLGTNTGANIDFSDIESIEVLRGPQGTLYGRNTIGGTISVRRTRPTGVLGAKVHARYGSFNQVDLDAIINLPKIGDAISLKLFGLRRTSNSFTRNRYTGKREDGRDYYNVGGAMRIELGGETSLLASLDYQKDRSVYPSVINLTKATGRPFGLGGTLCDFTRSIGAGDIGCETVGVLVQRPERFEIANTSIPFQSYLDGWNASLELNSKLGRFALTAITGFRDTRDSILEENSGSAPFRPAPGVSIPLFVAARDQTYKQFSQEVRIAGDLTDRIDLVAGAYYLHTDYHIQPYPYRGAITGSAFLLNTPIQGFTANQTLNSYAVFAESIIKFGETVRLTLGGRYTTETKRFDLNFSIPTVFRAADKATFSNPTGRVILDWRPNADTMLYGSWSRGFRSGGFNGRATTPTAIGPYDPERVDSFEAGLKADLLGGLLRFNPTVFWVEYNKKQEDIIRAAGQATETIVENAASARVRGIELEIQARPTRDLTLRASGGYLDPKYKSFLIPDLTRPGQFVDVSGARNFRRAPKFTFNAGVDYTAQLNTANKLNLTVDYAYIDDVTTTAFPDPTGARRDVIPGYGSVDASLALIHTGDTLKNVRVSVYGRDLLNRGGRISNVLDAGVFYFGVVSPRRQFGVEATVKF